MNQSEIAHLFQLMAQRSVGQAPEPVFGHISSYDADSHSVKVIIPSERSLNGTPFVTSLIPLGSPWAGQKFGLQIAPLGGATIENPTAGELVIIMPIDEKSGLRFVATMIYTDATPSRGLVEDDEEPKLKPGEAVMRDQKGSYWRFQENGDIVVKTNQDVILNSSRDVLVQGARNIQLNCLTQLQINNAPTISINPGNNDLNVEFITSGRVNLNADKQQVNLKAESVLVESDKLTTIQSKDVQIVATNSIRMDAPIVAISGQEIGIGNPDPSTNKTNKVVIDGTYVESIGRFHNKVMGKRIKIGGKDPFDPVRAHRIDIIANGAGGSLSTLGGGKVSKNIIAVDAPGAGSEFFVKAHTQAYGGVFLGFGKPKRQSIAEQEGLREAYGVTISATKYIEAISNTNLTLNAQNGLLFAQGKTAASIYSPNYVNIQAGNIDDPGGEVTVSGYNKATMASNEKVILQGSNDETDSVAIIGGGGIDIDAQGTFDVNSHAVFMVASTSDINLRTVGAINAGSTGGPFNKLVTEAHLTAFNNHKHTDSLGGETTSPLTPDTTSHTDILKGT